MKNDLQCAVGSKARIGTQIKSAKKLKTRVLKKARLVQTIVCHVRLDATIKKSWERKYLCQYTSKFLALRFIGLERRNNRTSKI